MQAPRHLFKIRDIPLNFQPVNGASLAYVEKGDGDAVVFVHGAITDLRIWLDQIEFFSQKYRAIAYSRCSHWPAGNSDRPGPYLRSIHANDLIGFLESLDLNGAHVVGHSFGGAVALLAAIERPDLIRSLTLGEPSPFPALFDPSDRDVISRQRIGFDEAWLLSQMGKGDAAIRKFLNVIVGADVLDQLTPGARSVVLENSSTLAPMLEHYYDSPALGCDRLKRVTAPVLLMAGELSPRAARIGNNTLNNCLANSREAVLNSTSHGLHIENPTAFNQVVMDFLDETAAAAQDHTTDHRDDVSRNKEIHGPSKHEARPG